MSLKVEKLFAFSSLFVVVLFITACNPQFNPDVKTGTELQYLPGFPDLNISSVGYVSEQNQGNIKVSAAIVFESLIYKKINEEFTANVSVEIIVNNKDKVVENTRETITISHKSNDLTQSDESFYYTKHIPVDKGRFDVQVTITDLHSGKPVTRNATAFIPAVSPKISTVSNIELLGKQIGVDRSFKPLSTYHVPKKIDSLKFRFQVSKSSKVERLDINSTLYKFRSDTTFARHLGLTDYRQSNLEYQGIEYDEFEILRKNRRVIVQDGKVFIEFNFPNLSRGNYRFEITLSDGNKEIQQKARYLGIKSENFPNLKTPEELARPLIYLMEKKQYKRMMAIEDPDSLKKQIDLFWVSEMKNTSIASQVIELYYERVRAANKKFSNFKEGWKTDRGMIYILYGAPWFRDRTGDQVLWGYTHNKEDPERTFRFERVRTNNVTFPFNHYVVDRDFAYNREIYKQVKLWRKGTILQVRI